MCVLVTQSCLTLCDPMDCSPPGFSVHHQLPEPTQTHVHRVVMPSNHLILSLQSFPASETFTLSQLFPPGGQNIGASTSALVLLMSIQD